MEPDSARNRKLKPFDLELVLEQVGRAVARYPQGGAVRAGGRGPPLAVRATGGLHHLDPHHG